MALTDILSAVIVKMVDAWCCC